jgi:hypothetical protein
MMIASAKWALRDVECIAMLVPLESTKMRQDLLPVSHVLKERTRPLLVLYQTSHARNAHCLAWQCSEASTSATALATLVTLGPMVRSVLRAKRERQKL